MTRYWPFIILLLILFDIPQWLEINCDDDDVMMWWMKVNNWNENKCLGLLKKMKINFQSTLSWIKERNQ